MEEGVCATEHPSCFRKMNLCTFKIFCSMGFSLFLYIETFRKSFTGFMDACKYLSKGGRLAKKLMWESQRRVGA